MPSMTRSRTDSPNAIAAIAVDVAVRALGGRRATEAGTASDEASEVVDALLPRVTRLSAVSYTHLTLPTKA